MKATEKRLENQNKQQQRILFNVWDDDTPFQWCGDIDSVVYRKYELAGYEGIEAIWREAIRSELRLDNNGNVIECTRYRDGKKRSKRVSDFNDSGMPIVSQIFDETGNAISENKYKYSSAGNLVEYTADFPERHNRYVYTYDTAGKLVQKVSYKDELLTKGTSYLYDENGRITALAELYPNGEIGLTRSFTYFKNGNLKSSMDNSIDEGKYTRYKYDSEGKIIETVEQLLPNETCHKTGLRFIKEWQYDGRGNVKGLTVNNGELILYYCEWEIKYNK